MQFVIKMHWLYYWPAACVVSLQAPEILNHWLLLKPKSVCSFHRMAASTADADKKK